MLQKENRLTEKKDFERVQKGSVVFGKFFLIRFAKNRLNTARVGIVVSKKISTKSTERNLLKRRIRNATRKHVPGLKKGIDIIIYTKVGSEQISFKEIEENIVFLLNKARLIND